MTNDARNGGPPRGRGPPLPHITDITATPRDIDRNQSLKRLLDTCESLLRSAETSREFKRPAIALKDYIRASIIAVHVINQHREYPTMQQHRGGDLQRRHTAVLKQIRELSDTYEGLKEYIRQDNAITKVQPTGSQQGPSATTANGNANPKRASQDAARPNEHDAPMTNGASGKAKPALKPKPQSLHGNALSSQHGRTPSAPSGPVDALAARFASLRGPQASPGQDPRIKTHSFAPAPRPSGPREMPPPQKPKIDIGSSVPALPKMPDAIYSPVRGNMSQESASLPTSTPRGFSRTGSGTSNAGTPNAHQPPSKDYFSPVISNVMSAEPSSLNRPSLDTTSTFSSPRVSMDVSLQKLRTETIEADELYRIMKSRSTVLIIDVRSREEYDEGHIMSSSVLCIEPAILTRKDLTADDILQSLVLHDSEQQLFEKRHEFDYVVFYDQASKTVPRISQGPITYPLISLQRALVQLSFECVLKQPPKLLSGGLDSWIDLMGANSLQVFSTSRTQHPRNVNKHPYQHPYVYRRASKYRVQPLREDDVRAWQETLSKEDNEAVSPSFHRTTEDFFRRFPEVPIEPEDMAPKRTTRLPQRPDVIAFQRAQPYSKEREGHERRETPIEQMAAPPQRPARAVPRPSHSGLTEGAYHEPGPDGQVTAGSQVSPLADFRPRVPAGLQNPGNWCYSNSVLQAILATRFGRILAQGTWKDDRKVPMKKEESIENPQLMMNMLHSLFNHMHGSLGIIAPELLMKFARALCIKADSTEIFGDDMQHDAHEYLIFLLTHMDDESNLVRHLWKQNEPPAPDHTIMSPLQFAADFWKQCHSAKHQSLIDEHFIHLDMSIVECQRCKTKSPTVSPMQVLNVYLPPGKRTMSLTDALDHTFEPQELSDYQCDKCQGKTDALIRKTHPYMSEILCICFARFAAGNTKGVSKNETPIHWDLSDFDMGPYFLKPEERQWQPKPKKPDDPDQSVETLPRGFSGKFHYETVAIVHHSGRSPGSGHYTAHVRDNTTQDRNAWLYCNDAKVSKIRLDTEKQRNKVFSESPRVPYMVFLQRKISL